MKAVTAVQLVVAIMVAVNGCTLVASKKDAAPFTVGSFEFALIGDTPYGSVTAFDRVVDDINTHETIRFVIHAGDIKTGSTPCSDELFLDRLSRFQRVAAPFILTPGDNEWTDCHRVSSGQFTPLERLAKIRAIFFPVPGQSLGKNTLTVSSQGGEFIENVRWRTHEVIFATLHIVGSNNGLAPFDPQSSVTRSQVDDEEVARRIAATVNWIDSTYAAAADARGVFFVFHANPGFEHASNDPKRVGFNDVLDAMIRGAKRYAKPVILAHGDSHYFRIDKPVRDGDAAVPNITRVETFGNADHHWLRIVVDPNSAEVFTVHPEILR